MSLNKDSKYYSAYYDHILHSNRTTGTLAKVYNLVHDISNRSGLKEEWSRIDGDVQDEIIESWSRIIAGD